MNDKNSKIAIIACAAVILLALVFLIGESRNKPADGGFRPPPTKQAILQKIAQIQNDPAMSAKAKQMTVWSLQRMIGQSGPTPPGQAAAMDTPQGPAPATKG